MLPTRINVFDLDYTILNTNSFREITKYLIIYLLKNKRIQYVFNIMLLIILRKIKTISHLSFKQKTLDIFENTLSENIKSELVNKVIKPHVNRNVLDILKSTNNCVITTASPLQYLSRMDLKSDSILIGSLDPLKRFPDPSNFRGGKLTNLMWYFNNNFIIDNFYTDSFDDQPLIDVSNNTYMYKESKLIKIK